MLVVLTVPFSLSPNGKAALRAEAAAALAAGGLGDVKVLILDRGVGFQMIDGVELVDDEPDPGGQAA